MAFNAQKNDRAKAHGGVWVDIMGGQFLVARAGNPGYLAAQERHQKRRGSAVEQQQALYRAIAEGILLDWREVTDAHGEPIPYSADAAVTVLDDNPELVAAILAEANDVENFRRDDIEDQKKKP